VYESRIKQQILPYGPHTRSNKFAQQCVVQQETVSIHDTICLRKLQSLGKCHNENMYKAACLVIILAYVTGEETV
jgi:hypothetical protein